MLLFYYAVVFAALAASPAARQAGDPPDSVAFRPQIKPTVQAVRIAEKVTVDGKLDEPFWRTAVRVSGFAEVQPGNQAPPQVETDVWLAYDDEHLYVAFRAYDAPGAIRATRSNRDAMFDDDWVGLMLDTYGDASQAYELFVNPYGVQADLLRAGGNEEAGFDMVFYSAGRLTPEGYDVEMAVPFSSLRFPRGDAHAWRATFIRNHPRDVRRIYSWATFDQNNSCLECQFGFLEGISDVRPGSRLQLIPSLVGAQAGALPDNRPEAAFDNGPAHLSAGLNARYDFTSSLAAEAALNPDFSQIESDAAQIDVNTTFALYYPERRPFFQEGSDLLRSDLDLVYTRAINDPAAAAKVTGKTGGVSLIYLTAVDENTPLLLPFRERSETLQAGRSVSNIARARYSFKDNSYVGGFATDQRLLDGGAGSAVSLDGRLHFARQYNLSFQAAASRSAEPSDTTLIRPADSFRFGERTSALDGEQFGGAAFYAGLDREARHAYSSVNVLAVSPTFRAASGFVTRNDYTSLRAYQRINVFPKNSFFVRVSPGLFVRQQYTYGGERRRSLVGPQLNLELKGQTNVHLRYERGDERFKNVHFRGMNTAALSVNTQPTGKLGAGFFVALGDEIARNEATPRPGRERSAGCYLDFKPTPRLSISPSLDYATLIDPATDERFYEGVVARTRFGYQFSRELSVRLFAQYNGFSDRLDLEPLAAYQVNPFTVFYVGSTHHYNQFDAPYGLSQSERQFFFKVQYLLQR